MERELRQRGRVFGRTRARERPVAHAAGERVPLPSRARVHLCGAAERERVAAQPIGEDRDAYVYVRHYSSGPVSNHLFGLALSHNKSATYRDCTGCGRTC